MTLKELIDGKGVRRVRKSKWADPKEFLQINGYLAYLVSPRLYELCQDVDLECAASFQDTLSASSQPIPIYRLDDNDDWEEYKP